jgi:hypothetical protein
VWAFNETRAPGRHHRGLFVTTHVRAQAARMRYVWTYPVQAGWRSER